LNDAVREAGALAMTMFRKSPRQWRKHDGSVVTEADIAVDRLLRERLTTARPGYGWISEESPDDRARLGCDRVWIADPIDGTRAFAKGTEQWCVAVALLDRGRPSAAAIYCPATGQFYQAQSGAGVRLNGEPLERAMRPASAALRAIGNRTALHKLSSLYIADADTSPDIPMLLRLCFVASGLYDLAVATSPKHDWDLAAGDLIVHEAGGIVTDRSGARFEFNRPETFQAGLIACHGALHGKVLAAMEAA
jgi:myo-inositol-1(or 4)-monophosphatase